MNRSDSKCTIFVRSCEIVLSLTAHYLHRVTTQYRELLLLLPTANTVTETSYIYYSNEQKHAVKNNEMKAKWKNKKENKLHDISNVKG